MDIQAYLRAVLSRQPETERVGPFLAGFDSHDDNPFRNYAVPDNGAHPGAAEVAALVETFRLRSRRPRLEYLPAAAPAVRAALLAAGFTVEDELPVMSCPPDAVQELVPPDGVDLLVATAEADLHASAVAQNAAYGSAEPTEHDVARLRGVVRGGGLVVLGRSTTGQPVGSGLIAAPVGGVAELAAVGVVDGWRRRGIAAAVVSRLTREAFAAGIPTPFLMAEGPAERRIHRRVGFADIGTILLVSRAPG